MFYFKSLHAYELRNLIKPNFLTKIFRKNYKKVRHGFRYFYKLCEVSGLVAKFNWILINVRSEKIEARGKTPTAYCVVCFTEKI